MDKKRLKVGLTALNECEECEKERMTEDVAIFLLLNLQKKLV